MVNRSSEIKSKGIGRLIQDLVTRREPSNKYLGANQKFRDLRPMWYCICRLCRKLWTNTTARANEGGPGARHAVCRPQGPKEQKRLRVSILSRQRTFACWWALSGEKKRFQATFRYQLGPWVAREIIGGRARKLETEKRKKYGNLGTYNLRRYF